MERRAGRKLGSMRGIENSGEWGEGIIGYLEI
jgi:hypothetical protein